MRVIKVLVAGLLVAFPLIVMNCQSPQKTDPIKIGLIVTQSDVNNPNYLPEKERVDAARLAVEEINNAGGVFGRVFELIVKDGHNSMAFSVKAARDIIHEGGVAIVGPQTSGQLICIADSVTIKAGIVVISPSATAPAIGKMISDTNNTIFRTCPSDEFQGKIAAQFLREKNIKTASILYIDNTYGQGLKESFNKGFSFKGKLINSVPYPAAAEDKDQYDFKEYVAKALKGNPEAVYLVSSLEGAKIIKDMSSIITEKKLAKPFIIGCDGNYDSRILSSTDKKFAEGMSGTAPANSRNDRNFSKFAKNFNEKFKYNVKSVWAATTYDAVYLIAYSLACAGDKKAFETSPKALSKMISENLQNVSEAGNAIEVAEFDKGVKTMQRGDMNYIGASGDIEFNKDGDVSEGTYIIWKVSNGEYTEEKTVKYP